MSLLKYVLPFPLLWLLGCATVLSGVHTNLELTSSPPGAAILSSGGDTLGYTPTTIIIRPRRNLQLTLSKEGYERERIEVQREIKGLVWLNFLNPLGFLVDEPTGAAYKLAPVPQVTLSVFESQAPPNARLTFTRKDLTVNFDASGSTDDLAIASYAWTFGDGATSNDAETNHTYVSAGTYAVTLIVTDVTGLKDTLSQEVTVFSRLVSESLSDAIMAATLLKIAKLAEDSGCDEAIVSSVRAERELYLGVDGAVANIDDEYRRAIDESAKIYAARFENACSSSNPVLDSVRVIRERLEPTSAVDSVQAADETTKTRPGVSPPASVSDPIFFDFNDWEIRSDTVRERIQELGHMISKLGTQLLIVVEGHADPVGTNEQNYLVAYRRAQSAAKELERSGVSPRKIRVVSHAARRPVVENAGGSQPGAELNRRVTFGFDLPTPTR